MNWNRERHAEARALCLCATAEPWELEYVEAGGYGCMTDSVRISADGRGGYGFIDLDLSGYGQERCKEPPVQGSEQAMNDAKFVAVTRTLFPLALDEIEHLNRELVRIALTLESTARLPAEEFLHDLPLAMGILEAMRGGQPHDVA